MKLNQQQYEKHLKLNEELTRKFKQELNFIHALKEMQIAPPMVNVDLALQESVSFTKH